MTKARTSTEPNWRSQPPWPGPSTGPPTWIRSPGMTVTPAGRRWGWRPRLKTETSCPRACSARSRCRLMNSVPPIPRTRMAAVILSEPAGALEAVVEDPAQGDVDGHDHRVAPSPAQLGHDLEVHAVDAGDHGGDREDGGPPGDPLGGLVLGDGGEREVGLERGAEQLAQPVHLLAQADRVVVDVPEVGARVVQNQAEVGPHEPVAHVDQGRDPALDLEQVALEGVDAHGGVAADGLAEDVGLERLQVVLERVHDREKLVHHEVHDRVQHAARPLGQELRARLAAGAGINPPSPPRTL